MAERGIKWIIRRPTYGTHAAGSHLRRNSRFITRRSEGQRVYSRVPIASSSPPPPYCRGSFLSRPRLSRALRARPLPPWTARLPSTPLCVHCRARLTIAGPIKRQSMLAPFARDFCRSNLRKLAFFGGESPRADGFIFFRRGSRERSRTNKYG